MPFQTATSNRVSGALSPHYFSIAVNSGSLFFLANTNSALTIATIRAPIPNKEMRMFIRSSTAFGAGESLVVTARYLDSAGTLVNLGIDTLNAANIPAAGEYETDVQSVPGLEPGTSVELVHVYVAGGTPNNPILSFFMQFS